MVKIFLSGCNGRMGQVINSCVCARDDCEIVAGADVFTEQKNGFPVFKSITEFDGDCDVIIDFSNPSALDGILDFATKKKIPAKYEAYVHAAGMVLLLGFMAFVTFKDIWKLFT